MLHCVFRSGENCCDDMTVLERQRRRMTWQPQQEEEQEHHRSQNFYGEVGIGFGFGLEAEGEAHDSALAEVVAKSSMKPDLPPQSGWATMGFGSCAVSATSTSTHTVSVSPTSSPTAQHTFRKRKSDKLLNSKVVAENEKKMKGSSGEEGESKMREENRTKNTTRSTNNKRDSGGGSSKENSNQKQEYIHVRARRGQATDSHSLAERVRREKISERMKYLQDLVPGCNKITGKAGMLDEIINYVQSLQRQVEFLSMKLAAVNPRLDFNLDGLFSKQVFGACGPSFPTMGMGSDMNSLECLQLNTAQQIVSSCGLDMGVTTTPTDMGLRRSFSAPVSIPETFLDSCCFTQILPSLTWESDFHNLSNVGFDQARAATSFPSQPFTGLIEAINPKMEM